MQSSPLNATTEAAPPTTTTTTTAPTTSINHLQSKLHRAIKATDQHRKRPADASTDNNAAAAAASDQMSSRQSFSSATRVPISKLQSESVHQDIVVKLRRDLWPSSIDRRQSSSSDEPEQLEPERLQSSREISDDNASSIIKRISFNDTNHANLSEPLIHTDKLNATSPLLYVYPARRNQKHHRNKHHHHNNNKQHSKIQTSDSMTQQAADQDQAAESSMSSAQLATLSAIGPAAGAERLAPRPDSLSHRSDQGLVPRLVVLNLEVGSSTATLTWTLALFPIDEWPRDESSPSSPLPISPNTGAREHKANAQQLKSVIGDAKQVFDDKPMISSMNEQSPTTLDMNGANLQAQENAAARQQRRQSDKSLVEPGEGDLDGGGDRSVGSTEPSGSSYGSSRLIVKRDTMRATLNRQNLALASIARTKRQGKELAAAAAADDKRAHRRYRQPAEHQHETESGRETDTETSGAEEIEGRLDLMRTKHSDADNGFSSSKASVIPASTNTTSKPVSELSLNKRLQLSHNLLQSLHSSGHNKRPPTRTISNKDDEPTQPMAESRSVSRLSGAGGLANGNQTARSEATEPSEAPGQRMRFVSRRKSKPSTSTTTTTTTPEPPTQPTPPDSSSIEEADGSSQQPTTNGASIEESEVSSRRPAIRTKAPRTGKSLSPEASATTHSPSSLVNESTQTTTPPNAKLLSPSEEIPKDGGLILSHQKHNAESATRSVQTDLEEQADASSPPSPINVIQPQRAAAAASTVTSSTAYPMAPAISVSATTSSAGDPNYKQVDSSKWLIRLRRFASNEVDIVKVLVNNLSLLNSSKQRAEHITLRYIAFKELEPSSAYELCIESASPNQQVGDKFRVLDANHFLKCSDTSDVELSSAAPATNDAATSNGDASIRRMDFDSATLSPLDLQQFEASNNDSKRNSVEQAPLTETGGGNLISHQSDRHQTIDGSQVKMKSLCKEFLTLPANSTDKINFGQYDARQASTSDLVRILQQKQQIPTDHGTNIISNHQWHNTTSPINVATANLRKAKSLNNVLKSRVELLEINDFNEKPLETNINNRPQNMIFEMVASRASGSRLTSIGSDNNYVTRLAAPIDQTSGIIQPVDGSVNPSATLHNARDYMSISLLPVLGCVFGLIFMITLANIVLSAVSCRSLRAKRRQSSGAGLATRSGMISHGHSRQAPGQRSSSKHTLGSFYGSDSDHSGTSQSRMVVVGKNGEPFGAGSAYFEVPNESAPNRTRLIEQSSSAGSSDGSGGKRSSSFLLSNSARFPLGPSFEGDEKHNADMVGLARKNYDNFINHIYNNGPQTEQALKATKQVNELASNQNQAALKQRSRYNHRHNYHHHHHHHHHHKRLNQSDRDWDPNTSSHHDNSSKNGKTETKTRDDEESVADQIAKGKRQRIRFDKINPIYNMEGLYSTSAGCVMSSTRHLKSPLGVSTFSHTNSAPILEEGDKKGSVSTSSSEFDEQCLLCQAESNQTGSINSNPQQQQQADSACEHCDATEICQEEGAYFNCCLDKQQQRFNKQQQQLERVRTKNGSLVPQPFINPIGPPRCGSPSCESIVREHDQQRAAAAEPQHQQTGNPSTSEPTHDKPRFNNLDSTDLISQHDKEDQEVIEISKGAHDDPLEATKPKDFFMFGEQTLANPEPDYNRTGPRDYMAIPLAPEPPSPLPADVPSSDSAGQRRKPLVEVATMEQFTKESPQYGAINKTDFNQRRTELESKLHLAGMIKPNP